jgi:hypothetical protein
MFPLFLVILGILVLFAGTKLLVTVGVGAIEHLWENSLGWIIVIVVLSIAVFSQVS